MIQSAVDVVNLALVKLGSQLVTTLDAPVTPLEKRAALIYPHLRDRELSLRRWRFSLRRTMMRVVPTVDVTGITIDSTTVTIDETFPYLDPTVDAASMGLLYAKLPDTCIRPLRDNYSAWEEEGRYLLTPDSAPFPLLFIARVAEPLFAPTFAEAFSAKIAEQLAEFLTQSNEKKDRATAMYRDAMAEAKLINAYDTGAEAIMYSDASSSFLTGRYAAGDCWGSTHAVGPYAGVRGGLAAVSPGVAPNPTPATVVADSDNSIPTVYVERDRPGATVYVDKTTYIDRIVYVDRPATTVTLDNAGTPTLDNGS